MQKKILLPEEKHFQERNMEIQKRIKTNAMGGNMWINIKEYQPNNIFWDLKYVEIKHKTNSIETVKGIRLVKYCIK